MNQARLAWAAFKNMLRAAARDPLWAFVALIGLPFRIWKPLLGLLFILIIALFLIGMGGRFALQKIGFGPGTIPFIALDLGTLLVLAWITFRFITNPLIVHFGDMADDTHGSARFATNKEVAPLTRSDTGLLIGRDPKSKSIMRYDGPAHLLTMAPTRTGKGVGTIIPPADRRSLRDLHRSEGGECEDRWPCAAKIRAGPCPRPLRRHRHAVGRVQSTRHARSVQPRCR